MRNLRLAPRVLLPVLVALPLAVPVAEAKAPAPKPQKGGTYDGMTSQEQTAQVTVSRSGRRTTLVLGHIYDCGNFIFMDRSGMRGPTPRNGRFNGSLTWEQNMPDDPNIGEGDLTAAGRTTVRSRFSRPARKSRVYQRVSGTWNSHMTILDASKKPVAECDTGTIRFSTRLKR